MDTLATIGSIFGAGSDTVTTGNAILRLFLSLVAGGLVGLERESHAKPAGFRTFIVISVGACLLMLLSIYIPQTYVNFKNGDPGRIAAQVVTGIGFLGAGAIMRFGLTVKGMTSAASIWAVAAVGMAIGAGFYIAALAAILIVLGVLHFLEILENKVLGWSLYKTITVRCVRQKGLLDSIKGVFDNNRLSIYDWSISEKIPESRIRYSGTTRISSTVNIRKLLDDLADLEGVDEIRIE